VRVEGPPGEECGLVAAGGAGAGDRDDAVRADGLAAALAHQARRQTKPAVPDAASGAASWTR
jgi:hypothetical protein